MSDITIYYALGRIRLVYFRLYRAYVLDVIARAELFKQQVPHHCHLKHNYLHEKCILPSTIVLGNCIVN